MARSKGWKAAEQTIGQAGVLNQNNNVEDPGQQWPGFFHVQPQTKGGRHGHHHRSSLFQKAGLAPIPQSQLFGHHPELNCRISPKSKGSHSSSTPCCRARWITRSWQKGCGGRILPLGVAAQLRLPLWGKVTEVTGAEPEGSNLWGKFASRRATNGIGCGGRI